MKEEVPVGFREKVYEIMAQVPYGRVITYGDVAGLAGRANAARIVGGVAHHGPIELPWHRLVNRFGGLASGFHGGREAQEQLLAQEGVMCTDFIIDNFKDVRWNLDPQTSFPWL
ncbi:MAG TPA: MGMT family protein [Candidatus Saccharimonadales bacterium]|nr:MGMT family protein [Candidatus Saccharimonadales bacterium]